MSRKFSRKMITLLTTVFLIAALAAAGVLPPASPAGAEELTARQIIDRVADDKGITDMSSKVTMRIINASGQERVRSVTMQSKTGADDLGKVLMRFMAPADVKGTAFLNIENKGRDDDRLLYLPALRKVRRISVSGRGGSFMGSDFTYADIGKPKTEDYTYRLLRSEAVDGADTYVLESIPKDKQTVADLNISKAHLWVHKDYFVIVKALYFDRNGKELKLLTAGNLQKIGGAWFALKMEMKNLQAGTRTVLVLEEVKVNSGLPDDLFTERSLQQ